MVENFVSSNFNMVDINVYECDSLMVTPMFKSMLQIKRYPRKRFYHGCTVLIEKSVPRDRYLASLGNAS